MCAIFTTADFSQKCSETWKEVDAVDSRLAATKAKLSFFFSFFFLYSISCTQTAFLIPHNPLLCLLLGKPGQWKTLTGWVMGGRMNQLPRWGPETLPTNSRVTKSLTCCSAGSERWWISACSKQAQGPTRLGGSHPTRVAAGGRGGGNTSMWTSWKKQAIGSRAEQRLARRRRRGGHDPVAMAPRS